MANESWTRRDVIKLLGAATLVGCNPLVGASTDQRRPQEKPMNTDSPSTAVRMPTVFLPHGGGPWPFMDDAAFGKPGMWNSMRSYMEGLNMIPPSAPTAVLVVSAHWEEAVPTVQSGASPPMLYDYSGFPPETYEIEWPAPGHPEVAAKIRDRLEAAGISTAENALRGFDHGVFVPMMLAYPGAKIPTLQLSLKRGLDPREHIAMGRALEPLRDEGVFIVGSGMSYHNLRGLFASMRGGDTSSVAHDSKAFDDWLAEVMSLSPTARETKLIEWEQAPAARASHPREEHLLPLMVIAGAAGEDVGGLPYRDFVMGAHVSAAHFG